MRRGLFGNEFEGIPEVPASALPQHSVRAESTRSVLCALPYPHYMFTYTM